MSTLTAYSKALVKLVPGVGGGSDELPTDELVRKDVPIDRENLIAYEQVCGFPVSDVLPATYPHMLAHPMAMDLMTQMSFPFGVVGMVHVENQVERLRPIDASERLDLTVAAKDLRPHDRGRQFDIVATASVDGTDVYRAKSTYLHREKTDTPKDDKPKRKKTPPVPSATWKVPGSIGREYGVVSGDMNPIHLYPITAKLFGFERNIAHGMWLQARCLAALSGSLPDAYTVSVAFKLPMLIPATVAFSTEQKKTKRTFAVNDARTGKPHLTGEITPRAKSKSAN